MGGHYGTIHVRTENRDEVRSAVERLSSDGSPRFLIAPPINGWVTIFPEQNGQDSGVSERLATVLESKTLIHCMVHDDDLFAYWLFEKGAIVDRYNSCPDYFGDSNPPSRGGNARALSHLLIDPSKVNELQELLDAERFDFELERQDKFAALLGLPNTAYAYEYLQDGETDGVRRWKAFIHVPDLAPEKAARRAAAKQERDELKRLQRDEILLVDQKAEKSKNKHFFKNPYWAIDRGNCSVVLIWQDTFLLGDEKERMSWQRFAGPEWRATPWSGPEIEQASAFEFSGAGAWFVTKSQRASQLEIWNAREMRLVATRNFTGAVSAMTFSADENWLFAVVHSPGRVSELHRLALRPGLQDAILTDEVAHFQRIVPHPDGRLIAVVDNFGILMVVEVETMRLVTHVWIKEMHSLLPEGLRDSIIAYGDEGMIEILRTQMSPEQLAQYRKQSARHFLPKEALRVCCFSPDGAWLCCGTNAGVRVLEWNEVLRCEEMQRAPVRWSANAEPVSYSVPRGGFTTHSHIYGVVFDPVRQRVLFSGLEGKICFLELKDQRTGDLLIVPGKVPLIQLGLTPDRSAIVATWHRITFGSSKQSPPHFQIWNYRALCEAANLEF